MPFKNKNICKWGLTAKIEQQENPMKKTRFSDNQIVNIFKQVEQGVLITEHNISQSTFITGGLNMAAWMPRL